MNQKQVIRFLLLFYVTFAVPVIFGVVSPFHFPDVRAEIIPEHEIDDRVGEAYQPPSWYNDSMISNGAMSLNTGLLVVGHAADTSQETIRIDIEYSSSGSDSWADINHGTLTAVAEFGINIPSWLSSNGYSLYSSRSSASCSVWNLGAWGQADARWDMYRGGGHYATGIIFAGVSGGDNDGWSWSNALDTADLGSSSFFRLTCQSTDWRWYWGPGSISASYSINAHTYISTDLNWIITSDGKARAIGSINLGALYSSLNGQGYTSLQFKGIGGIEGSFNWDQWDYNSLIIFDSSGNVFSSGDLDHSATIYFTCESLNTLDTRSYIQTDSYQDFTIPEDTYHQFLDNSGYIEGVDSIISSDYEGGAYINTRFFQPNELFTCRGTSTISDTGLGSNPDINAAIALLESYGVWDPGIKWEDTDNVGTNTIRFVEYLGNGVQDTIMGQFGTSPPSANIFSNSPAANYYPLYIYETNAGASNTGIFGSVAVGMSADPVKVYEYDVQTNMNYDGLNGNLNATIISSQIYEPGFNFDRVLTGALIKVVEDDEMNPDGNLYDETEYVIPINKEFTDPDMIGIYLDELRLPESVYTYETLSASGMDSSGYNEFNMKFSELIPDGVHVSLEVKPRNASIDNDFILYSLNDQFKNTNSQGWLSTDIMFYYHSDNEQNDLLEGPIRLPRRNLALQIEITIKNGTDDSDIWLEPYVVDAPILYLGDIHPPEGYPLFGEYYEIITNSTGHLMYDLVNPDEFGGVCEFIYEKPTSNDPYYYVTLLQDEKSVTYGKENNESCLTYFAPDILGPEIYINQPSYYELFGRKAPLMSDFDVTFFDFNDIDNIWYMLDDGISTTTNYTWTGEIEQTVWEQMGNGTISVIIYANDSFGNVGFGSKTIRKDIVKPIITINNPEISEYFQETPPIYQIDINEPNLKSAWYTIDNGLTNFTIITLTGEIDETAWSNAPEGNVFIRFYALDEVGNIDNSEVIVIKDVDSVDDIPAVSGYNIIAIIGIIGITIILIKRKFNQ